MSAPLLSVEGLSTYFYAETSVSKAVCDVSYTIAPGETLGVVGESGCGKSVTALSVLRLIPEPPGRIIAGKIMFNGTDLLRLSEKQMRAVRGNSISMIFQEPMTSLNPVFRVGEQIMEPLLLHNDLGRQSARAKAIELLHQVGIPSPASRAKDYPHQMSGGMRQRVMIAMALACNPKLIIADEPTTALDVTIQAQILALMDKLRKTTGTAMQLITHDLGVIAHTAQNVIVMYAGQVVEQAQVRELFAEPLHPYTQGLMRSIPSAKAHVDKNPLVTIPGTVPSLHNLPQGCRFHTRCTYACNRCRQEEPPLAPVAPATQKRCVRCWLHQDAP